jgi:hypothetical protein
MAYDKFLIAPITGGIQSNVRPWLIMDEAFENLSNMYVWRGRIKKRFGAIFMNESVATEDQQLLSRFRVKIGTTDAAGNLAVTVPGTIFKVGQSFSAGSSVYTVNVAGAPAILLISGTGVAATYNTTNGAFTLTTGPLLTDVYFYPSEPVMNFFSYYDTVQGSEVTYGWDTQFVYKFTYAVGWQREIVGNPIWSGTNHNFYYASNYRGATADVFNLWVVNYVVADLIWYYNGITWAQIGSIGTTGTNSNVGVPATDFIQTALIIVPFKDRLLMMNTKEFIGGVNLIFPNRIRFSQNGDPLAADTWSDLIAGKGGFQDIPNNEAIISVGFIKDRMIIYMEESTWELCYTGNEIMPFVLQQINSELGVDATGSLIPFDKAVLGFGTKGIHTCNGINVDRIDELIPQFAFNVENSNNGVERTAGIRDYYNELAYWSYNSVTESDVNTGIFPNTILVYNYINETWATNDDSITAFGYFQDQQDITWEEFSNSWESSDLLWRDPSLQSRFRTILGGNQQGFTFIIDAGFNTNSPAQYITNMTFVGQTVTITSIAHNLPSNSYVQISSVDSTGTLEAVVNDNIYKVNTLTADTFTIITATVPTGVYLGKGNFSRVSDIEVLTKQFNFYNKIGQNIALTRVDFLVDRTSDGEVSVNSFCSSSDTGIFYNSVASGANMGTNILETRPYLAIPVEQSQDRFWHYMYFQSQGENVQLRIFFNDDQIVDPDIIESDIEIGAMLFYTTKTSGNFGG